MRMTATTSQDLDVVEVERAVNPLRPIVAIWPGYSYKITHPVPDHG